MNNYMNTDYTRDELITLALKMAIRQARKWQDNAINECDIDAAEHYENLANAYRAIIEENHAQQAAEAQQEAPAAEAEQQHTETENAPQAATQAAEGTEQAPDPDAAQVSTEDGETCSTAAEAATVAGIIRRKGGYRERDLLTHPHEMIHGETWNDDHKIINVLDMIPDPDGYRPGCAVDIVTRAIVG